MDLSISELVSQVRRSERAYWIGYLEQHLNSLEPARVRGPYLAGQVVALRSVVSAMRACDAAGVGRGDVAGVVGEGGAVALEAASGADPEAAVQVV